MEHAAARASRVVVVAHDIAVDFAALQKTAGDVGAAATAAAAAEADDAVRDRAGEELEAGGRGDARVVAKAALQRKAMDDCVGVAHFHDPAVGRIRASAIIIVDIVRADGSRRATVEDRRARAVEARELDGVRNDHVAVADIRPCAVADNHLVTICRDCKRPFRRCEGRFPRKAVVAVVAARRDSRDIVGGGVQQARQNQKGNKI